MTSRVLVVGGGIAGLAHRFLLHETARQKGHALEVVLWSPVHGLGGNLRTVTRDGFRIEEGAESLLASRTEARDLAVRAGLAHDIVEASPHATLRFILRQGRLCPLPRGPFGALFGSFPPWAVRWEILREPFRARRAGDESVADFVRRRVGPRFLETLLDPVVTGIFAARPEDLSVEAAFPAMKSLENQHGSLVRGAIALARRRLRSSQDRGPTRSCGRAWSFRGGMASFARALTAVQAGPIHLHRPLTNLLRQDDGRWEARSGDVSESFDQVILALPAHALTEVAGDLPAELRELVDNLSHTPVAVVATGWRREDVAHDLEGFGFLVPRTEKRRILGTLFTSTLWPDTAPAGHVLLRTMVGGGRQPNLATLPPDDLAELVREELTDLLGCRGRPQLVHVVSWPRGIPCYPVGHARRVTGLCALGPSHGLWCVGQAFDGIGVGDVVRAAVERIPALLARSGVV